MNQSHAARGGSFIDPAQFILDLVLRQVHSTATESQEQAFLVAVGRDIAARFPLGETESLAALEEKVNDVWHMLDLGVATITLAEDAILIRHDLPDNDGRISGGAWRGAVPWLVEGAYDAWLRAMGSGPRLQTTQTGRTADHIELRHGG